MFPCKVKLEGDRLKGAEILPIGNHYCQKAKQENTVLCSSLQRRERTFLGSEGTVQAQGQGRT